MHLAVEVGDIYSIIRPDKYIEANINGFFNIIDSLKYNPRKKFLFASSSSVYGDSNMLLLKENLNLEPIKMYALSKKNNVEVAKIYNQKN